MSPNRFEHLCNLVGQQITKQSTNFQKPISAPQRLPLSYDTWLIKEARISPHCFITKFLVFLNRKCF